MKFNSFLIASVNFILLLIAEPLCTENTKEKIVTLGSGPAGLTAGIYAARSGLAMLHKKEVTGIRLKNLSTKAIVHYPCIGVFIAIGQQPNTQLFQDQLDIDSLGYLIAAPHSTTTNVPGVFAAGDVADSRYRQAITAAGFGCMAAIDADHFLNAK